MPESLLFIDTNILLAQYTGQYGVKSDLVQRALAQRNRIITTAQVRDEFHRRRVAILASVLKKFEVDPPPHIPEPIQGYAASIEFGPQFGAYKAKAKLVRDRLELFLEKPKEDPCLQLAEGFFTHTSELNGSPLSADLVNRATQRMALGNPPGKHGLGDAINWEWCLDVCKKTGKGLIICSGDGDYGEAFENRLVPNWYLHQEFDRRVGPDYGLKVTKDLEEALDWLTAQQPPKPSPAAKTMPPPAGGGVSLKAPK